MPDQVWHESIRSMKPQDIGFFIILAALLLFRRPVYFLWAGLLSLVLAIPLFATWTFFTAERLTWYAGAFFFIFILISLHDLRRVK